MQLSNFESDNEYFLPQYAEGNSKVRVAKLDCAKGPSQILSAN